MLKITKAGSGAAAARPLRARQTRAAAKARAAVKARARAAEAGGVGGDGLGIAQAAQKYPAVRPSRVDEDAAAAQEARAAPDSAFRRTPAEVSAEANAGQAADTRRWLERIAVAYMHADGALGGRTRSAGRVGMFEDRYQRLPLPRARLLALQNELAVNLEYMRTFDATVDVPWPMPAMSALIDGVLSADMPAGAVRANNSAHAMPTERLYMAPQTAVTSSGELLTRYRAAAVLLAGGNLRKPIPPSVAGTDGANLDERAAFVASWLGPHHPHPLADQLGPAVYPVAKEDEEEVRERARRARRARRAEAGLAEKDEDGEDRDGEDEDEDGEDEAERPFTVRMLENEIARWRAAGWRVREKTVPLETAKKLLRWAYRYRDDVTRELGEHENRIAHAMFAEADLLAARRDAGALAADGGAAEAAALRHVEAFGAAEAGAAPDAARLIGLGTLLRMTPLERARRDIVLDVAGDLGDADARARVHAFAKRARARLYDGAAARIDDETADWVVAAAGRAGAAPALERLLQLHAAAVAAAGEEEVTPLHAAINMLREAAAPDFAKYRAATQAAEKHAAAWAGDAAVLARVAAAAADALENHQFVEQFYKSCPHGLPLRYADGGPLSLLAAALAAEPGGATRAEAAAALHYWWALRMYAAMHQWTLWRMHMYERAFADYMADFLPPGDIFLSYAMAPTFAVHAHAGQASAFSPHYLLTNPPPTEKAADEKAEENALGTRDMFGRPYALGRAVVPRRVVLALRRQHRRQVGYGLRALLIPQHEAAEDDARVAELEALLEAPPGDGAVPPAASPQHDVRDVDIVYGEAAQDEAALGAHVYGEWSPTLEQMDLIADTLAAYAELLRAGKDDYADEEARQAAAARAAGVSSSFSSPALRSMLAVRLNRRVITAFEDAMREQSLVENNVASAAYAHQLAADHIERTGKPGVLNKIVDALPKND